MDARRLTSSRKALLLLGGELIYRRGGRGRGLVLASDGATAPRLPAPARIAAVDRQHDGCRKTEQKAAAESDVVASSISLTTHRSLRSMSTVRSSWRSRRRERR